VAIGIKVTTATILIAASVAGCAPRTPVRVWSSGGVTLENLAVAANGELRVGFYTATIRDDCTQTGKASVKPTVDPQKGVLRITEHTDVPTLSVSPNSPRAKCVGRRYPGVLVTYKPEAGYVGDDRFGIDVIWPNGNSIRRNILIHVR
jgi:hypothetical protein